MKTFYKLLSFSLIIFLILNIFAFSASAAGVVIDGTISTSEWENAESFVILESKSNAGNNIDFAEIKALRNGDSTVYLALTAVDTTDEYLDDCGMQITIPSVGVYSFGSDNSSDFQPNDSLSVDYEATADLSDTFFIELELVFKKAVKNDLTFKIQVKDNTGVLSNESEFTVKYVPESNSKPDETTTVNNSTGSTSTTKFRNESTTKFSATENNSDSNKSDTSSESVTEPTSAFIAKSDPEKTSVSEITRIVLSVLAAVLIIAAGALLIFARPSEKKQDKKSKDEENSEKKK